MGGYYYFYYADPTYVLVIAGALLCLLASWRVNSAFRKYSRVYNARGITAEQAASMILRDAGIYDVRIERIRGNLTDHYSPREKVLRLSDGVFGMSSVAAIGVAAHECGHAIQHQQGYLPIRIRSLIVPVVNFSSKLSWPVIIIGVLLGNTELLYAGILLFAFVVVFQLVTLPVEFDASGRAIRILRDRAVLSGGELKGAKRVLRAAAMTYVASMLSSLLQLLRLVLLYGRRQNRR
ncbi:MAG: zinc metallopeptidase [Clostridiaceae bacterium]|nr:zinc metallopeptidase [Clostridiaceae bacterium]